MIQTLVGDAGIQFLFFMAAFATALSLLCLPDLSRFGAMFERLADAALLTGLVAAAGLAAADPGLGLATACLVGTLRRGLHLLAEPERLGDDGR
ncbi:MAG: hypothetical protein ACFBWO_13510 [Paracoccaceae bacterium]